MEEREFKTIEMEETEVLTFDDEVEVEETTGEVVKIEEEKEPVKETPKKKKVKREPISRESWGNRMTAVFTVTIIGVLVFLAITDEPLIEMINDKIDQYQNGTGEVVVVEEEVVEEVYVLADILTDYNIITSEKISETKNKYYVIATKDEITYALYVYNEEITEVILEEAVATEGYIIEDSEYVYLIILEDGIKTFTVYYDELYSDENDEATNYVIKEQFDEDFNEYTESSLLYKTTIDANVYEVLLFDDLLIATSSPENEEYLKYVKIKFLNDVELASETTTYEITADEENSLLINLIITDGEEVTTEILNFDE